MYARVRNDTQTQVSMLDNQGDLLLNFAFPYIDTRTDFGYIFSKTHYTQSIGTANMAAINVFDPQYGALAPITKLTSDLTYDYGNEWSYFLNHQSRFFNDKLIATVGLREDEGYTTDRTNNLNGTVAYTPPADAVLSKMFALMARPVSWLGVYGTYSFAGAPETNSLLFPSASVNAVGQQTLISTPTTLDREFGAKAELLDNKLSVTLTHFDILAQDVVFNEVNAAAPGGKENIIQPGNSAIGWELAANGYVTDHLQIEGGYDYVFTHYALGKQQSGTPLHKGVMLFNYGFRDWQKNQWHAKFGVLIESESYGTSAAGYGADLWRFPATEQFDIGVDYKRGPWIFDFSIRNLTNTVFVEYGGDQTSNTVNTPREFFATIARRW
jgi:outer membrane receptor for monomeric catechols